MINPFKPSVNAKAIKMWLRALLLSRAPHPFCEILDPQRCIFPQYYIFSYSEIKAFNLFLYSSMVDTSFIFMMSAIDTRVSVVVGHLDPLRSASTCLMAERNDQDMVSTSGKSFIVHRLAVELSSFLKASAFSTIPAPANTSFRDFPK